MGYYMSQGDYYRRGDYYRSRGGLFSFIGSAARTITGAVAAAGIPIVSSAAGVANRILTGSGTTGTASTGSTALTMTRPTIAQLPSPLPMHLPGGPTPIQAIEASVHGIVPRGTHVSKRTGALMKNRHMNMANPRALRRAIRREKGFVKLARSVLRGTGITIGRRSFAATKRARR